MVQAAVEGWPLPSTWTQYTQKVQPLALGRLTAATKPKELLQDDVLGGGHRETDTGRERDRLAALQFGDLPGVVHKLSGTCG